METCVVQEDIALSKSNTQEMTPAEMNENKNECAQLDDHFSALHTTFEETSEKQHKLSEQAVKCKKVCDENLGAAKTAHTRYEATLKEERRNLDTVLALDRESAFFHDMALEQIKYCSDQVEYSREQTSGRIKSVKTEIERLQRLQKEEEDRLQHLVNCKAQIDKVKEEEETRAKASAGERGRAKKNMGERVMRAEKGVKSSADVLKRIEALYKDVQQEFEDALSYSTEVRKAIGVDCHTAFLGHGKFLAIQREMVSVCRHVRVM